MTALLIISVFFGAAASSASGVFFIGLAAGVLIFVCGLPSALLFSFVHGEVSYAQDRADCRQEAAELRAEERAEEREFAADGRIDRLVESVKKNSAKSYNDNRQIHFHGSMK
jgi:hypothetical protein